MAVNATAHSAWSWPSRSPPRTCTTPCGGKLLLDDLAAAHPGVSKVWADGGYQSSILNHGASLGIDVEVVQRPLQHRRLARDYEALPQRSRTVIHWAMANQMSRELTGESTPTWRIETDTQHSSA